jgi:hypothetical protein
MLVIHLLNVIIRSIPIWIGIWVPFYIWSFVPETKPFEDLWYELPLSVTLTLTGLILVITGVVLIVKYYEQENEY